MGTAYVSANGDRLALSNSAGTLNYGWNLTKPGLIASHEEVTGAVADLRGNVIAANPGFVDQALADFQLLETSAAREFAGLLPVAVANYQRLQIRLVSMVRFPIFLLY